MRCGYLADRYEHRQYLVVTTALACRHRAGAGAGENSTYRRGQRVGVRGVRRQVYATPRWSLASSLSQGTESDRYC